MSKKDYELIAKAISQSRTFNAVTGDVTTVDPKLLAHYLIEALAQANPRFDSVKFLKACGL